uniref:Uncharacterized protein n=1 Tax=Rhizophora mucronata TaxID=61149 RepID=A0A2P2JQW6_RHIMU
MFSLIMCSNFTGCLKTIVCQTTRHLL